MGWSVFSLSSLTGVCVILIVASFFRQMHDLMYPLANVIVEGPTIPPLWDRAQSYDLVCFLSTKKAVDKIDFAALRKNKQIIYEQSDLIHDLNQDTLSVSLELSTGNSTKSIPTAIFNQIYRNASSVYMHVVAIKKSVEFSLSTATKINPAHFSQGQVLHGAVKMIKYDIIPKHFHHRYLLSDWNLVSLSEEERMKLAMPKNSVISYWKPEVSIKLVSDFQHYPEKYVTNAVAKNIVVVNEQISKRKSKQSNSAYAYKPSLFVDEIGLTSDKYIALNQTVTALPLKISIGPMATERWYLMEHLEDSLRQQKGFGFQDKDIDDVRRMISDTSLSYLTVTIVASVLHLIFEMMAFKSDISFWQANTTLTGLSVQSLIIDWISQLIIFLYLLDSDTSALVLIPAFISLFIQVWKIRKATGLTIRWNKQTIVSLECTRWKRIATPTETPTPISSNSADTSLTPAKESSSISTEPDTSATVKEGTQDASITTEDRLAQVSMEADYYATRYLSIFLFPIILCLIVRSLLYEQHASWYSWMISSLTSCVYTFGFITMCPQLYINHQLKSVSHLPWQYLIYKFLNTFVDDLFAFIIKMPLMHRLSVFRDDIVFLIYLYQRYIYRVDANRPIEK